MAQPNQQIQDFLKALNEANTEDIEKERRHKSMEILYEESLDAYALSLIDARGSSFSGYWDSHTYYMKAVEFQPHLERLMVDGSIEFDITAVLGKHYYENDYNYPEDARASEKILVQDGQIKARLSLGRDKKFIGYNVGFRPSPGEPYEWHPPFGGGLVEAVKQRLG